MGERESPGWLSVKDWVGLYIDLAVCLSCLTFSMGQEQSQLAALEAALSALAHCMRGQALNHCVHGKALAHCVRGQALGH